MDLIQAHIPSQFYKLFWFIFQPILQAVLVHFPANSLSCFCSLYPYTTFSFELVLLGFGVPFLTYRYPLLYSLYTPVLLSLWLTLEVLSVLLFYSLPFRSISSSLCCNFCISVLTSSVWGCPFSHCILSSVVLISVIISISFLVRIPIPFLCGLHSLCVGFCVTPYFFYV